MKRSLVSILSLVLVLCMLASMPLSAFAEDTTTEPTLTSSTPVVVWSYPAKIYSNNKGEATGNTTEDSYYTISEQYSYSGVTYGKIKDNQYIEMDGVPILATRNSTTAVTGTVKDGTQSYTDCLGTTGAALTEQTVTVSEQWTKTSDSVVYGKISDGRWIKMSDFTETTSSSTESTESSTSSSDSAVGQSGVISHTSNVNVRSAGSMTGSNKIDTIAPGTEVTVYAERVDSLGNLWYKISDTEERWVISTYVTLNSTSSSTSTSTSATTSGSTTTTSTITASKTGVINHTGSVNVRNAGSIVSGSVVSSIASGTEVGIYDEHTDSLGNLWYKISETEDKWVISTYVKITDSSSSTSSTSSTSSSTTATNGTIANCSTGANYRSKGNMSGDVLGRLAVGSRVTITKVEEASNGVEWGYADGYGWICMTYVTLDSTSSVSDSTGDVTSTVTSTTGAANANITVPGTTNAETVVYLNADTSSTKLITLGSGQTVSITGRALVDGVQWGKVTISGNTGWVQMKYINLTRVTATVSSAQLNAYNNYTDTDTPILILGKGQTMTITDSKTDGTDLWGYAYSYGWVNMSGVTITTTSSSGSSSGTGTSVSITCTTTEDDVPVYANYDSGSSVLLKLAKSTKITVTELKNSTGQWGKVTIDSYTGWIDMNKVTQDSVTGTVSTDNAVLYTKNLVYSANKSGKTLSSGTSVTILERTLFTDGETVVGKLIYNGAYYYIKMSNVTLGSSSSSSTTSSTTSSATTTGTTTSTTTGTSGTVVNTDTLNVRSAAGVSNTLVTTLSRGASVTVYEQTTVDNALWGRIDQGWVAMAYIDLSSNSTTTTASTTSSASTIITTVPDGAVAVGYVNYVTTLTIRKGAGLGYDTVGTLKKGANVVIYEQKLTGGMIWGRIDQGWICTSYVTLTGLSVTGSGSAGTVARCFFTANVRSSAGIGNALVGKVMVNSRIEIYETTTYSGETWGRTSIGWINMEYVLLDSE